MAKVTTRMVYRRIILQSSCANGFGQKAVFTYHIKSAHFDPLFN